MLVSLVPGVLVGEPVMNGSARGTAVVGLVAAVLLAMTSRAASRGSVRVRAVAAGLATSWSWPPTWRAS